MKKIASFFKSMVLFILTIEARIALALHTPYIIAITGNVGKTTTKELVACMLRESGVRLRASRRSYNSEFGVPLSILGVHSAERNGLLWFLVLLKGFWNMLFNTPRCLVLEVGVEYPGDIQNIVSWLKPDISLLTQLSPTPVHGENFPSREDLFAEKVFLLKAVKVGGVALYNKEDAVQADYFLKTGIIATDCNSLTLVHSSSIHYDDSHTPVGMDIVLHINGKEEVFYIPNILGGGIVRALANAIAIVLTYKKDIPITAMRKAIASRDPVGGRMRILPGINGSVILDDTYNSSPIAVLDALKTLESIDNKKKVVVFGVMAQLGDTSVDSHKKMGVRAAEVADEVLLFGDAPYGVGTAYDTHQQIIDRCKELATSNTVFLCKGSQVARIEKIVKGILADTVDSSQVLVRQDPTWLR